MPWARLPVVSRLTEQTGWTVDYSIGVGVAIGLSGLGYHGPVLGSVPVYTVIKHMYGNKKIPMDFVGDTRMLRVTDEGCLI